MIHYEYSIEELSRGTLSLTEYLGLTSWQRKLYNRLNARPIQSGNQQMTNKQILAKYFTKKGRIKRQYDRP